MNKITNSNNMGELTSSTTKAENKDLILLSMLQRPTAYLIHIPDNVQVAYKN